MLLLCLQHKQTRLIILGSEMYSQGQLWLLMTGGGILSNAHQWKGLLFSGTPPPPLPSPSPWAPVQTPGSCRKGEWHPLGDPHRGVGTVRTQNLQGQREDSSHRCDFEDPRWLMIREMRLNGSHTFHLQYPSGPKNQLLFCALPESICVHPCSTIKAISSCS